MTLPRYPAYKDSGVEWLGEVPAHWEILPCRAFVDERTDKNYEVQDENYLSLLANVGVIPYDEKGDIGNKKPEDLGKCKLVNPGDLVINSMNYGIGSYGLSSLKGVCSPVYIVLRPRLSVVESRYAFRIFQNREFQTYAQSFGNGILAHRAAIGWGTLKGIHVGLPPMSEQETILKFLDHETSKIDALVAEQKNLIALLKEKRQAVISHAVTKGLDPDMPMKDSGVEWLGEVPVGWQLERMKRVCNVFPSNVDKKTYDGDPIVSLCNYTDVYYNDLIVEGMPLMAATATVEQIQKFTLQTDDTIITKDSETSDDIGVSAYVPQTLPGVVCGYHLSMVRPITGTSGRFIKRFFDSGFAKAQMQVAANGLTRVGLSQYALDNLLVPYPPLSEQTAIATFIDHETSKIDTLIREAEHTIGLLQERRSALISAAVTGKIDVRGLVREEAA